MAATGRVATGTIDRRYVVARAAARDRDVQGLGMNEIGRVVIKTQKPLNIDYYRDNRMTGSFILIDPHTNATVGAGMIWRRRQAAPDPEPEW